MKIKITLSGEEDFVTDFLSLGGLILFNKMKHDIGKLRVKEGSIKGDNGICMHLIIEGE